MYARIHEAKGDKDIAESAAREFLSLVPDGRLKTIEDVLLRSDDNE